MSVVVGFSGAPQLFGGVDGGMGEEREESEERRLRLWMNYGSVLLFDKILRSSAGTFLCLYNSEFLRLTMCGLFALEAISGNYEKTRRGCSFLVLGRRSNSCGCSLVTLQRATYLFDTHPMTQHWKERLSHRHDHNVMILIKIGHHIHTAYPQLKDQTTSRNPTISPSQRSLQE